MLLPKHTFTITGTLLLSALLNMQSACAGDFNSATLVEARGDVFKRGFVDWNRELWEDPMPAKKGDRLNEGMQLGTGDKSWAQLAWTNVTARAWANSIYAVAPNQRLVYLLGGEMLYHLDKHRKDKAPYYVWTKLVQARVRGTTILFQNTANSTRISVLEGSVDVLNRLDRSVVRITPGVVYEVKDLTASAGIGATGGAAAASAVALNQNNVTLSGAAPVQLFQTSKTLTSIYALNPQAALGHPLLGSFPAPLSSLPLVEKTLVPLVSKLDGLINGLTGGLGGLTNGLTGGLTEGLTGGIAKNLGHINWANGLPVSLSSSQTNSLNETVMAGAQVLSVPRSLAYKIGPLAGTVFTLPRDAVSYFPPSGVIGVGDAQETGPFVLPLISSVLVPSGSLISKAPNLPATKSILSSKLSPLLASATESSSRSVLKNLHDLQPSKTLIGSVSGTGVLDISSLSGRLGSVTSGLASLASLGSITPSFSTSSFSVGSIGGGSILPGGGTGGGAVGGLGGAVGGLGGAVGGLGGAVGGLGGAVGGLGGAVGGLGGAVGGTVGGAVGGLGGTVGGLGGTVGGLLGGGSGGGGLLGGLGGLLGH